MSIEEEYHPQPLPEKDSGHLSQKSQEEEAKKQWDRRYGEDRPYLEDPPVPLVVDFLEKNFEKIKDGPFLDLGCGNGRNLLHLAKKGLDVYGMDLSRESLTQLKERLETDNLKANIQEGSFYNLPFKEGKFSGGISNNALQHNDWEGAEKSFAEISRVLADNAPFFLSVRSTKRTLPENREDLKDRGITFIPKTGTKAGIMIHHYTEEEIRELAKKNSLEIIDIKEKIRDKKEGDDPGKRGHWVVTLKRRPRGKN